MLHIHNRYISVNTHSNDQHAKHWRTVWVLLWQPRNRSIDWVRHKPKTSKRCSQPISDHQWQTLRELWNNQCIKTAGKYEVLWAVIKQRRKMTDHLNSCDVWVAMFLKRLDEARQNVIDSQCAVVENYYQPLVLLFTHSHCISVLQFIHSTLSQPANSLPGHWWWTSCQ